MIPRINLVAVLTMSVFVTTSAIAGKPTHPQGKREIDHSPNPKYSVEVQQIDNFEPIEDFFKEDFFNRKPYAKDLCDPFFYKEDADADGKHAFLVAGVNCDSTLAAMTSLTGIPLTDLTKRGQGDPFRRQFRFGPKPPIPDVGAMEPLPPEWFESNNRCFRSSGDGFLAPGEDLRARLLLDNKIVRNLGSTHQDLARPMLLAIEAYRKAVIDNKDYDREIPFMYEGEKYSVSTQPMSGQFYLDDLRPKPASEAQAKEKQRKREIACSGWVGIGIQGSFFQDELFTDRIFEIKNPLGSVFSIDGLTPHLIYRYGFYQGGQYRVNPLKLVQFFKPKKADAAAWSKCSPSKPAKESARKEKN